jgi:rubrerythrin
MKPDQDTFSESELEELSRQLEQWSRELPAAKNFKDLGSTPLAKQLGLSDEQMNGHWCSRCEGIWFGYTLEVECPVCGNRRG